MTDEKHQLHTEGRKSLTPSNSPLVRGRTPSNTTLLAISPTMSREAMPAYRRRLEGLKARGVEAWLYLEGLTRQTRYHLKFTAHTFSQTEAPAAIQRQLRDWHNTAENPERIYLLGQADAATLCYHITDHVERCVNGDITVAERLKGRTVFRLYQTSNDAWDVLSREGLHELCEQVIAPHIHGLSDLQGNPVVGFCIEVPAFLSPLKAPPLSVPWSDSLLQFDGENAEGTHLPLVFYETYDSAAVRAGFWAQLTRQFADVFVKGLREYVNRQGLELAVCVPDTQEALEVDVAAMLKPTKHSILLVDGPAGVQNLVIAKQMSSHTASAVGLWRKTHLTHRVAADSSLGFNWWLGSTPENDQQTSRYRQFLSVGQPERQVLVISPISSLWTKPELEVWKGWRKNWIWLCETLWGLGYDFDIASELTLAGARIEKSKEARGLRLQDALYHVVLMPSCLSLHEKTVEMLEQFVKMRRRFIVLAPPPYLLNGRVGLDPYPLERLLSRWHTAVLDGSPAEQAEKLSRLLRKRMRPRAHIYRKPDNTPTREIVVQHRQTETLDLFYFFHRAQHAVDTLIEIHQQGEIEEWLTSDGQTHAIHHWHSDGKTYLEASFQPRQGRFIALRR